MSATEFHPANFARSKVFRRSLAFLAMLGVALLLRATHLTVWDSWDYATAALRGESISLFLGRWWFIATMRAAYELGHVLFGLAPLKGYLAMQLASALMAAGAIVVLMAWTYRLTESAAAEILVPLILLPGPLLGIYASTVMTESMTLLFLTAALLAWENVLASARQGVPPAIANGAVLWAFGSGVLFGIVIDIREPAVLFSAWPIISCFVDRPVGRWKLLGVAITGTLLTLAVGIIGSAAWFPGGFQEYWQSILSWTDAMVRQRQRFPVQIFENLKFLFVSIGITTAVGTLILPFAIFYVFVRRSRLRWLVLAMVPYALALLANHDLMDNPQYCIPLIWVLSPAIAFAVADFLIERRSNYHWRLSVVAGVVALLGMSFVVAGWQNLQTYYFEDNKRVERVYDALQAIPQTSTEIAPVVVPGIGFPMANHLMRMDQKNFTVVTSGWDFPHNRLAQIVAEYVRQGREVYVNVEGHSKERQSRDSGEWAETVSVAKQYEWDRRTWPLVRLIPSEAKGR